jgi:signal transduction histidine kinase
MDLLLGARWDVQVVERGDLGWRAARERSHDLVIASVRLPGMSGIELTRRLRHDPHTQDVALILTSRSAQQPETLAGLEAGADDFLVKPFSGRELLARVNTRLELTAMRRRNVQQAEALANLQRNLKSRDEFLSAASHELRTPLTTLSLQTDSLLVLGDKLEQRLQKRLGSIRRQVERLTQLVEQLLDVSRLVEGRMSLQPEAVDLGAVVRESVELLRDSATQVGSPVSVETGSVVGYWDRVRIGQVVTNLLSNAIKFGCGSPIEVVVEADDITAHLRVTDGGEGIPPQEQARIFDRFERATSVRQHPGLGLGLWICKQIVEASRGTISVRSQIGKGTTFTVDLPRRA